MDNTIFTSQFQSVIYRLMFDLFERLQTDMSGSKGEAATPLNGDPQAGGGGPANASALTLGRSGSGSFASLIQDASQRYGVNPALVQAVVKAESNYNPSAVSSAGAQGLMQLMPATARGLGVADPFDPAQNVDGGVRLLRQLLDRYGGNVSLALAAYNAGPGAVDRFNGIPPYAETQTYVRRVMDYFVSNTRTWEG